MSRRTHPLRFILRQTCVGGINTFRCAYLYECPQSVVVRLLSVPLMSVSVVKNSRRTYGLCNNGRRETFTPVTPGLTNSLNGLLFVVIPSSILRRP